MERDGSARLVKENVRPAAPLGARWLAAAAAATALALAAVARLDSALPAPLDASAPAHRFIAEHAMRHLINLTSFGPRVAGSYENEVVAVAAAAAALRGVARAASRHNRLDVDLHSSSGAFPLSFLDGMNNVYLGVQSVVGRLSGVGSRHGAALLINCHFDSVPDSPGASDDAAGCAVALEVARALAAAERPLRHDVIVLLNGAEENIMQASHSFITTHKWARQVRAFINIEACGAGGREVLFQAGPHDPWIMEVYSAVVPRPFASSLAQELFESGVIPGDTDFRVFRDFGNLSGVDLAWNANGYVYHTRLDTWQRVPPAALQRTGDNVLALATGLLQHEAMQRSTERAPQPVFFDVLGLVAVCARGEAAAAAAVATLALVVLRVHLNALDARKQLYMRAGAWWRLAGAALLALAAGGASGLGAACAAAAALSSLGARLPYYTQTWLLAPLYALPALCTSAVVAAWLWRRCCARAPLVARGWWAARLCGDALALGWALLLAAAAARRLRSGAVPLLPALLPTLADLLAALAPRARVAAWCAGWALPVLQLWYLALSCLNMFVPLAGRAGSPPVPIDVVIALLTAALALAACGWLLPFYLVTRGPHRLVAGLALWSGAIFVLVACGALGAPYCDERPQRLMLFHTRRSLHPPGDAGASRGAPVEQLLYWVPHVDDNTRRTLDKYVAHDVGAGAGAGGVRETAAAECARWVYCGAPYFLPALGFVRRGYWLPARAPPRPRLAAAAVLHRLNSTDHLLTLNITGPAHVVVVAAPTAGGRVARYEAAGAGGGAPQLARPWGARRTYFFALHRAHALRGEWLLRLHISHPAGAPEPAGPASGPAEGVVMLSVAGHAMFGVEARAPEHAALLERLPPHVAATGWAADLHLFQL